MVDVVQPDSTIVQQLLKRSRSLWSSYVDVVTDPKLPVECLHLRKLLGRVPPFPTSSLQTHKTFSSLRYSHSHFGLQISGQSTWRTSLGECRLPSKTLRHELLCGVYNSVGCSFAEQSHFMDWPGVQGEGGSIIDEDGETPEGNHLAILTMAWAYILSARWVELQLPHGLRQPLSFCGIRYSDLQAARPNAEE